MNFGSQYSLGKNIGTTNNFGSKEFVVQKNCWSKKMKGKKISGPETFQIPKAMVKKKFCSSKFLAQNNLWYKKIEAKNNFR